MRKFLSILFSTALIFTISACDDDNVDLNDDDKNDQEESKKEWVDYTEQVTLTKSYANKSFITDGIGEVTLVRTVDGDTAHFAEKGSSSSFSVRFLGVNTPESTGKIEEWGKAASNYTADILENATTIVLESSTGTAPSMTNNRYLGWVWVDGTLLNLEIVQQGYSKYSSVEGSSYNQTMLYADFQAQDYTLNIWSKEADPDFYYGDAIKVTLKEIRENILEYNGTKVCFEGVITRKEGTNAYIQYIDPETNVAYGLYIYTMYSSTISNVLAVGNEVQVTGQVGYYDFNGGAADEGTGAFQLVDTKYNQYFPSEDDIKILSTGNPIVSTTVDVSNLNASTNPIVENTFVNIQNLTYAGGYTETDGDMTINLVDANGIQVNLRINKNTVRGEDNSTIITSHTYFQGKNINVNGIVTKYNGSYQVLVTLGTDISYLN